MNTAQDTQLSGASEIYALQLWYVVRLKGAKKGRNGEEEGWGVPGYSDQVIKHGYSHFEQRFDSDSSTAVF